MTTQTLTLAEFLLERFAEREAHADGIHDVGCGYLDPPGFPCDCGEPARVRADCAAKRQIVEHAQGWEATLRETPEGWTPEGTTPYRMAMHWTLARLALPYADHPDFNDDWRP